MTLAPDEVGVARERLIGAARRLFHVSANIGAAVAIIFGVFAILAEPSVLDRGWLHVKILLVLVLLAAHVRLYLRITALENEPLSATRREFSIIHGVVSLLVLVILGLVFLKPF
jgi:putative membrane protein